MFYSEKERNEKLVMKRMRRLAAAVLSAVIAVTALPFAGSGLGVGEYFTANAASPASRGVTKDSVTVRKSASILSRPAGYLKKGAKVTISKEVFTSKTSRSAKKRWYKIRSGKKKGYVRADFIKISSYGKKKAIAIDDLNYRKGAGTSMKRVGTLEAGANIKVCHSVKAAGSSISWYKVIINKKKYYVCGDYIAFVGGKVSGSREIANKLQIKATNGGKARYVGTLNSKNCIRVMTVKGDHGAYVPQGMAYTGSKYYIVFGMSDKQRIVTYSSKGKRLASSKFTFNMGKPNGITYDPVTNLCYILRGSQYTIYTWNPSSKLFGTATTPYSSSGIAYDKTTNKLYASSTTGIRVYSADGNFILEKFFPRCSHSGRVYVHDCGASRGYVFHALSGSNKFGTNYLDVYRAEDGKYMGSFKVNLGELEGVIVDSKGYVQLLINCGGTYTEWIWKTPINVNNLQ